MTLLLPSSFPWFQAVPVCVPTTRTTSLCVFEHWQDINTVNPHKDSVTIHEKIGYKYEPCLFITKPFVCSSGSFSLDGFCEFFLFPAIKRENPAEMYKLCVFTSSINLITGHLEEPMPNPMDEMTEEQKEYEAMKLVNMFDKLSRYCTMLLRGSLYPGPLLRYSASK